MSDVFAYLIAGLLLLQALLRIPAALKGRVRERSLWGAFAALAAAWLTRTTLGRSAINTLGIEDFSYLVKHVLAILGICVLLRYVTAVYSSTERSADLPRTVRISALVHRIATRASLLTVAVMAAVFFTLLDTAVSDTPYFMARHAGQPGLAVYMSLFYLYTAAAAAVCAVQWGGAVRQAPMRSLRIGLSMMSLAMSLAVLYAILRTAYVVLITITPVSESFANNQETVTDSLLYATFLLWGFGAIAPATRAAQGRFRAMQDLTAIHPLWRDLALTAPDVVQRRPSQLLAGVPLLARFDTVRDLVGYDSSPSMRLARYVTEIRDVIHELRRHAPHELAERSVQRAEETATGPDRETAAEAYWIRAARAAFFGRPSGQPAPFPFPAGDDFAAEVPHLRDVAAAYGRIKPTEVTALLSGPPAVQPASS
ncbi:MAB_1171c family putative transporter [Streptomyces griseofuscus]|uniref:MAB_1171c family putative transporter n=1 Tax=Streptomycetaceae TaxID=2062 RepID=UPI00068F50FB|nr:MAB_1171c family putative transporter [Actinacidiphila yeochonensis]